MFIFVDVSTNLKERLIQSEDNSPSIIVITKLSLLGCSLDIPIIHGKYFSVCGWFQ